MAPNPETQAFLEKHYNTFWLNSRDSLQLPLARCDTGPKSPHRNLAKAVLTAREPHLPPRGVSTLADLYHPLAIPAALAQAHAELDRIFEKSYRPEPFHSDRDRVEHLFLLYETHTNPLLPAPAVKRSSRRAG